MAETSLPSLSSYVRLLHLIMKLCYRANRRWLSDRIIKSVDDYEKLEFGRHKAKFIRSLRATAKLQNSDSNPMSRLKEIQEYYRRKKGPILMMPSTNVYGIYEAIGAHHLVPPDVFLNVHYGKIKVYNGNIIPAARTRTIPEFNCEVPAQFSYSNYFTLVMINPDGCLFDPKKSMLHWLVMNIPKNSDGLVSEKGTTVCDYLQPLPWQGTGLHRIIFAVYAQPKYLKLESGPADNIFQRTFDLFNFMSKVTDLQLVTYSFFQCHWDPSVTTACHDLIRTEEPIFAVADDVALGRVKRKFIKNTINSKYKS